MRLLVVALALFGAIIQAYAQTGCPASLSSGTGNSGQVYAYVWQPSDQNTITAAVCNTVQAPCGPQDPDNKCANTASGCCFACQSWNDASGGGGACLGTSFADVSTSAGVISLHYTGGDPVGATGRDVYLDISCGSGPLVWTQFVQPASDKPPPHNAPFVYRVVGSTSAACGAVGGGGTGGMVFVILLIVCFAVYFIGFALLNKFKNGAEGMEIIPHREFWADTPTMFMEGVSFLKGKIMGLFGREGYSSVN